MLTDLRTDHLPAVPAGAVVVVGSGAAGIALATALAGAGRDVVLLESGGDVADPTAVDRGAALNGGTADALPYEGLDVGRARVLGGTTQLWHGQCMRLHPVDLAERSWVPRSGWPLTPQDLDPWYAAAERFLDVSGRGYGEDRWADFPRLAPVPWDGSRLRHDFTEYMRRPYLGTEHRDALAASPHVRVVVEATATRVLLDDAGRAAGVEVALPGGGRAELRAAEVVLAAGTLENARLLQLSDPAGVGLGDGREHTGRYLQDHPIIRTGEVLAPDFRVLQDRYVVLRKDGRRLFPKVRLAPEAQEREQLLDATAVFVHEHDHPGLRAAHELGRAVRARRLPAGALRTAATAATALGPVAHAAYRRAAHGLPLGARPSHVWLQLWVEQAPDPARRVVLDRDRLDPHGQPRARVTWTCDDEELRTTRTMSRWVAEDLERLGVGRVRPLPAQTDDDAWRRTVTDAAHPAGTTRMATTARDGVVGTDLQVHGVPGLSVVGGSVFPTSGYANPTLTVVALALRLAARLLPGA
ncbi:GMC oxidoreductase [Pseudokineococcus lusitanus]|uniref:Choline dehydrogenase-like flavoprotein n=1 Tax=Pseudokineococcus lusitanus TaxID=763993 RepID=A0A3N1HMD2_9ACTN|nr:GMC oxidoreductase [Pseudokineococcus lusitanus]ROP43693.1 choline dehydrogenase-like flavoprotein [Pseudokineococcus lusitanus]